MTAKTGSYPSKLNFALLLLCAVFILTATIFFAGCSQVKKTSNQSVQPVLSTLKMTISWPAKLVRIPTATESIKVTIKDNAGYQQDMVVNKPATENSSTMVWENLPVGELTVLVAAYPQINATGLIIGSSISVINTQPGETQQLAISVNSTISHITVTIPVQSLRVGDKIQLAYKATDSDNRLIPVAEADLTWTSSNTDIATIDTHKGTVTFIKDGVVNISIHEEGSNATDTVQLTVLPAIDHAEIISNSNNVVLKTGETLQLSMRVFDTKGGVVILNSVPVVWNSADDKIATVTTGGLVTGKAYGTVIITAAETKYGLSARIELSVIDVNISQYWGNRQAAVCYTFDDGALSQYTIGVPLLNEFNIHGTFFISPAFSRMDLWRIAATQGHEIGNHSYNHLHMTTIADPVELSHQVNDSIDVIAEKIGVTPVTFAVPFLESNQTVINMVMQRHIAYRATQTGFQGAGFTATFGNNVINNTITQKKQTNIMIHGIDGGGWEPLPSAELRKHFEYVTTLRDKVWIDTFANLSRYKIEREKANLQYTVDKKKAVITLIAPLDNAVYTQPLTVNINIGNNPVVNPYAERNGNPLPVVLTPTGISIDIMPDNSPVTVTWQ